MRTAKSYEQLMDEDSGIELVAIPVRLLVELVTIRDEELPTLKELLRLERESK